MGVIDALRSGSLALLKAALDKDPKGALAPRLVVEAGRLGWKNALALLKRHGADLNARWRGYRALHSLIQEDPHAAGVAPTAKRLTCLKWLLKNGADPEQPGAWPPARAILIAAFVGEPSYVDILVAEGARVDGFAAAALGDAAAVRKRLRSDPAFAAARDGGGLTALQCCAASRVGTADSRLRADLLAIAGALLDAGADPNLKTRSWNHEVDALYFASSANQTEIYELLLQRGANPLAALSSSLWRKDMSLAEIALRYGAHPDAAYADGRPALNELVRWGQVTPALWLLGKGANPNLPDTDKGWTAVHQAASRGNERLMAAILAAGGDASRKDRQGNTPIDVALSRRKPRMAEMLRGRGWVES